MTDDNQSPPALKLPDSYYMPADIRKVLGAAPPASAFGQERRTELDVTTRSHGRLRVEPRDARISKNLMELGSKVGGLTNAIVAGAGSATAELTDLTTALREGAAVLNKTVETGNQLSHRVFVLNALVVLLMIVQIALGVWHRS